MDREKDKTLQTALDWLSEKNIPYIPLDIEKDIQTSYEQADLKAFRETVRSWMRELAKPARNGGE